MDHTLIFKNKLYVSDGQSILVKLDIESIRTIVNLAPDSIMHYLCNNIGESYLLIRKENMIEIYKHPNDHKYNYLNRKVKIPDDLLIAKIESDSINI